MSSADYYFEHTRFRSPEVLSREISGKYAIELSMWKGLHDKHVYDVTVVSIKSRCKQLDLSKSFECVEDADEYIKELR